MMLTWTDICVTLIELLIEISSEINHTSYQGAFLSTLIAFGNKYRQLEINIAQQK